MISLIDISILKIIKENPYNPPKTKDSPRKTGEKKEEWVIFRSSHGFRNSEIELSNNGQPLLGIDRGVQK